jgi:hypothetical protein
MAGEVNAGQAIRVGAALQPLRQRGKYDFSFAPVPSCLTEADEQEIREAIFRAARS